MSTRKKRTTVNSTKGASSSLDEEPSLSALLTQEEALPDPNPTQEAELAKLRKEAEELARTKKRLLAIQHEAEIQKQKAEIAILKEELRALKAKQSLSFTQLHLNTQFLANPISMSALSFSPSLLRTPPSVATLSRALSNQAPRTRTFTPFARDHGTPNLPCLRRFRSLHGHKRTGQFHCLDSRANLTQGNF
jgi:hypothetical protein